MSKITKNRMLAERYTTEEMKKDVNDLFKAIAEAKDEERYRRIQGIKLINIAYERIVSRNTEYIESIKRDYKHELAVIELTDEDSTVGRQAAEKVLLLLAKYGREELSIVLESVLELKDNLIRSRRKSRETQLPT